MTPFDIVKSTVGTPLFIFEHGLGDFINFLPVFKEFCRQTKTSVKLCASSKRQFHLITKDVVPLEDLNRRRYSYIYRICYPDSMNSSIPIELHTEAAKPYLCAYYELGMKEFAWKPYVLPTKVRKKKRIGVHLFGHTGMDVKFCPDKIVKMIWKDIKQYGYEPYEIHMIPQFSKEYSHQDRGDNSTFGLFNKKNSLRFEEPDLKRMIEETAKCKFFIGIDSGPIYLATALIGCGNVVGLINGKRHDHFLPKHISLVDVNQYQSGDIKRIIQQKELQI